MSAAPAVTVLLPTHNRADVLPFAIRSVLAQTLRDFELIVVGDGCTDGSAGVVAAFEDPRVRWLDLPKASGFGYANRNRGLREARGELVAYIGHDDLWLPDHLELLSAAIRARDADLAASRLLFVSPDGTIRPQLMNLEDPAMIALLLKGRETFGPSCVVHRRDCLERYGYWAERLDGGGDWELWVRILTRGGKPLAYCDRPTAVRFLADWRTQSRKSRLLNRLRRLDGSVPDELRVAVPDGVTEQEAFWREIEADPTGWPERLRRGVRIELGRLARMEYPSSLTLLAYGQWQRLAARRPHDRTKSS